MNGHQEYRQFKMHDALIYSVIKSQAGTLSKAILEAIQNSVDSNSSKIEITISNRTFSVIDDGRGFLNKEEIEHFFELFGTPHKEGDAVYGRFRMGRGQIFSFGKNKWRSGHFTMHVDVKAQGIDYLLEDSDDKYCGCKIDCDLYAELTKKELKITELEIRTSVKWVNIPVYLNGELISNDPLLYDKWIFENEHCYFEKSEYGELKIYNIGVFVKSYSRSIFGLSGTIISKAQLQVNFARNDILITQCELWKQIKIDLNNYSMRAVKKKKFLTVDEIEFTLQQLGTGELCLNDVVDLPIIKTGGGQTISIAQIKKMIGNNKELLTTICPAGKKRIGHAVSLIRQDVLILDTETLSQMHCAGMKEFFELIGVDQSNWFPTDFDYLSRGITTDYRDVDFESLTKKEREGLEKLVKINQKVSIYIYTHLGFSHAQAMASARIIMPGQSDMAQAWTDGNKITVERNILQVCGMDSLGLMRGVMVLVHEYLHNDLTENKIDHDYRFYKNFHDIILNSEVLTSGCWR